MTRAAPPPTEPRLDVLPIPGIGPEDVLLRSDGLVVVGVADGRILGRAPDGAIQELAQTGGRPLGLDWLPDGRLLVCDADRGLLALDLRMDAATAPEVLCNHIDGRPLTLCNNPTIAPDGTIWFTNSSVLYGLNEVPRDIIGHTRSGQLLRLGPDGQVDVLMDDLAFANGVTYLPGATGDRVLVAATGEAAIHALWITGDRAGTRDIFAEGLPMMPDNLSLGSDGLIWAGGPSRWDTALRVIHRLPAALRHAVAHVAMRLGAGAASFVGVMAFDHRGRLVHRFETQHPDLRCVTSAREHGGTVWLGSVEGSAIARFPVDGA